MNNQYILQAQKYKHCELRIIILGMEMMSIWIYTLSLIFVNVGNSFGLSDLMGLCALGICLFMGLLI